ncbi:MAG: InlB B-repeat-containing protein [Clostridia bacterium]|nr:InlB B-repeat-containing protein [Clostridia bacterium]
MNTTNAPKNVPAGESFRLPNPSQSGYKFTGWNTSADGSGTNYNGNANVSGFTEDTTLYARWNKKYGINYIIVDTNGTQLSTGSKSMEVPFDSDETVFPLPALTRLEPHGIGGRYRYHRQLLPMYEFD